MKATIDILNSIVSRHTFTKSDSNTESSTIAAPEKVLVFSQFTKVLDLLEPLLNSNGIQFRRLDGKMNLKGKDKAVKDFKTIPEVISTLLYSSRNLSCFHKALTFHQLMHRTIFVLRSLYCLCL